MAGFLCRKPGTHAENEPGNISIHRLNRLRPLLLEAPSLSVLQLPVIDFRGDIAAVS